MFPGGMPNAFCILALLRHMITYLSGMRTWEWSILMQKSEYSFFRVIFVVIWIWLYMCILPTLFLLLMKLRFYRHSRYIKLVKKHGLEISQPGLEPNSGLTWQMTKRRGDSEVHKWERCHFILHVWPLIDQYKILCLKAPCDWRFHFHLQRYRGETWLVQGSPLATLCSVRTLIIISKGQSNQAKHRLFSPLNLQICGDNGTCVFSRGLALCLAHDSGEW